MIEWLNSNSGAVLVAVTTVYTFVTWRIVRATRKSVDEQRLMRTAQFRPHVWADLDVDGERHVVHFVLSNTGHSTAYNVRIVIDPPFSNANNPELSLTDGVTLIERGIDVMVPGKTLSTLIGVFGDFPLDGSQRHSVTVVYEDELKGSYRELYELDIEVYKGLVPSAPRGLDSVAKEMEKVNKTLNSIRTEIKAVLASDRDSD